MRDLNSRSHKKTRIIELQVLGLSIFYLLGICVILYTHKKIYKLNVGQILTHKLMPSFQMSQFTQYITLLILNDLTFYIY